MKNGNVSVEWIYNKVKKAIQPL